MTDRFILAYALLAMLVLGVAGAIAWVHYNSDRRKTLRRRRRELKRRMDI